MSNTPQRGALSNSTLKEAFRTGSAIKASEWGPEIPFSKTGVRWAGSGETLYSLGGADIAVAIRSVLTRLELLSSSATEEQSPSLNRFFKGLRTLRIAKRRDETHGYSEPRLLPAPEPKDSPSEELTPQDLIVVAKGVTPKESTTVVRFPSDDEDAEELDARKLVHGAGL